MAQGWRATAIQVAAAVVLAAATSGCVRSSPLQPARLDPEDFRRLFAATVVVTVSLPDGRDRVGSGFVASRDGWIVTSSHVVSPVEGDVTITYANGEQSGVAGIYSWAARDLAVVVPRHGPEIEPLRLADSARLQEGEVVFACGVPFGLGRTLTRGVIAGRSVFHSARYVVQDGILAAGVSYPGDSGGPVVNADGQVVGIHLGTVDSEQRAVVPSNLVRRTLTEARVQAELRRRQRELERVSS